MTAPLVWKKRAGSAAYVHAFAANACVDVPLCGARFRMAAQFVEVPPPPARIDPLHRCRICLLIAEQRLRPSRAARSGRRRGRDDDGAAPAAGEGGP